MNPETPTTEPVTPTTDVSINSNEEKQKNINKNSYLMTIVSIISFVILALGAIIFLYYQNQQLKGMLAKYQQGQNIATPTPSITPNITAGWKNYTNTRYGFLLKYPNDYNLTSCTNCTDISTASFIDISPSVASNAGNFGFIMVTWLKDISGSQSVSQYLSDLSTVDSTPVTSSQPTTINGYQALVNITQNKFDGNQGKDVFITDGVHGIEISFQGSSSKKQQLALNDFQNFSIFDPLLSTFIFSNNSGSAKQCNFNGHTYNDGDKVPSPDKCNSCSCNNRQVACTTMACQ